MRIFPVAAVVLAGTLFSAGCFHLRSSAESSRYKPITLETKRKYKVIEHSYGAIYTDLTSELKKFQPKVYDENGIEVVVRTDIYDINKGRKWINEGQFFSNILSAITLTLWPNCSTQVNNYFIRIQVNNEKYGADNSFDLDRSIIEFEDNVLYFTPTGFLLSELSMPAQTKKRVAFSQIFSGENWVSDSARYTDFDRKPKLTAVNEIKAYLIADVLRNKIEARGFEPSEVLISKTDYIDRLIEARNHKRVQSKVQSSSSVVNTSMQQTVSASNEPKKYEYKILRLEKTATNDFEYEFEIAFPGGADLQTFRRISHELRNMIAEEYAEEHMTDIRNVQTSYPTQKISGNIVSGRVGVYEFEGISMSYDSNARRGTFSVKVVAGDFEATRRWVRKNIESIVADKNILIKTGERPPQAHYKLLNEEVKDGVIVVEFEAE